MVCFAFLVCEIERGTVSEMMIKRFLFFFVSEEEMKWGYMTPSGPFRYNPYGMEASYINPYIRVKKPRQIPTHRYFLFIHIQNIFSWPIKNQFLVCLLVDYFKNRFSVKYGTRTAGFFLNIIIFV